jgi:uncharacterized protein (TIGR02145 family)
MKKTIYLTAILITGFIANAFGQDSIVLSFTARNNAQHQPLDSILVMNLSQGGDTMLYAPDTALKFSFVGLNEHNLNENNSFSVSPNYPNPFIGQTFVDVRIEKRDRIDIRIVDLSGREHASYEGVLNAGKHTFTFNPGNENFYIFSVSCHRLTRSTKIVNPLSGISDCKLSYSGFEQQAGNLKSHREVDFPFSPGDTLRYIGYSSTIYGVKGSDVINDDPEGDSLYIFEITEGVPCVNTPTVFYQFKLYNTVQIGTQCWLKENLDVGTMITGTLPQWDNGIIEKYCYNDLIANCASYGGFYQWNEMMIYTTDEGAQGICPPGWHIPTDEEWKQLEGEVDSQYGYPDPEWDNTGFRGWDVGQRLKSSYSWITAGNGNDYVGFCALASGVRIPSGAFVLIDIETDFWSSTEGNATESWYRQFRDEQIQVFRNNHDKTLGRSVRCLKDN